MDWIWGVFLCCIGALGLAAAFLRRHRRYRGRMPPGPPGWPVFGNMFDLGTMPHKTLAGMKETYGGVVRLRIGSVDTVVLLTAGAAAELFRVHDATFAERKITDAMTACRFHEASVSLSPYGPYWRVMKRLMTTELLVQRRVAASEPVRRRCIGDLVVWIADAGSGGRAVHVAKFVFLASFNMLGNLMLSRDLVDPASAEGSEFFDAMVKFMEWSGHPNVSDLFPWLRRLDPQGLRRKAEAGMGKTLDIVARFVAERLNADRRAQAAEKDYLDVLLECSAADGTNISQHDLNIIVLEIFLAGSETTSSSIEWAMVELLKHPAVMEKAKAELRCVVARGEAFHEQHIERLPYLQAVVKETLRMHPPIPFLVPRRAIHETNFMGYHIPRDTQLFVNTWAIGRDPECWEEPMWFNPDRFLGSKVVDYKGQHYELIPFGAGRRICAGIPLAHRMLHLILGTLLHEFKWSVDEIGKKGIRDERERMGITVRKLVPLEAIPRKE